MKNLCRVIGIVALGCCVACGDIHDWENNPRDNFDALWTVVDEHYCFFKEKNIDWDSIYSVYSPRVGEKITSQELFVVCSEMLDELRDGHVNLSSPYATSYYRQWWSLYPENYDSRIIEKNYFNFNYNQIGPFTYGYLPENIGYIHVATFSGTIGEGNLDYILNFFAPAQALIVDLRSNGGGDLTASERLASRFITERTLAGYISHKTGPGHDEFSEPRPYYFTPPGANHQVWVKPMVVLTNRSTFSAANSFVAFVKELPHVSIVGATTGGGSGMPYSTEIPNGWGVRMSACSMLDAKMRSCEDGIEPDVAVDMPEDALVIGRDAILDAAVVLIESSSMLRVHPTKNVKARSCGFLR